MYEIAMKVIFISICTLKSWSTSGERGGGEGKVAITTSHASLLCKMNDNLINNDATRVGEH